MNDAYRETPPPTREEFSSLEERVTSVERRKPRAPFVLRLWHTLVVGLAGVVGTVYATGMIYDDLPSNGTKVSAYITMVIFGLVSALMAICSLGALDASWRDGLGSPWRRRT